MAAVVRLAGWEWFRLRKRADFLTLAIIALVIAALSLAATAAQNVGWTPIPAEFQYPSVAAGVAGFITPLLAIILAALIHAGDLQHGNCRTLAGRGAPRAVILASKALAAAALLLAFHLCLGLMALIPSAFLTPHFAGWPAGLPNLGVSLLNSLLYHALGMALAYWRQSTAFTVGVGLAFIFFEAVAYPIAGQVGLLLDWPVSEVTAWTIRGVAGGLRGDSELLSGAWFIPIVASYAAALAALSLLAFRKFDLRAGGD